MTRKTKLELTWPGKEDRPRLEPRILLEHPERGHHAATKRDGDLFDNMLIKGDNLLALKALEQEYAGKVKCIYIDPPFNTKQALPNYDDGLEHSIWLSLMRYRLMFLHSLLREDGTLFVHIDDNELGYLIAIADEIFGRSNRISIITFKQGAATGHKAINPGVVSTSNFLIMYAKHKPLWRPNKVYSARDSRDARYGRFILNRSEEFTKWQFTTLAKAFAAHIGIDEKAVKKELGASYEEQISQFVVEHAQSVIRQAKPDYKAVSSSARSMIDKSVANPNEVFCLERDGHADMFFQGGQRILFYSDKLKLVDGQYVAGEPLTSIWDDLLSNNLHNEGGFDFPKGKKPESLVKRCIELATEPGDLVLDSFSGSGTTGAVAHKMHRRWIMVEIGDHADTHIVPRISKVVDGDDHSGITKAVGWKGGGGFRYYTLAPSLLERDAYGNWIIAPEYNGPMLAQAMCKHLGFTYDPTQDEAEWWRHGRSSETDFLYVTTQALTQDALRLLSQEVGPNRSLLICARAFSGDLDAFENLTCRKIPSSILSKCEWGRDDYSLNVAALPEREESGDADAGPLFSGGRTNG
ncbi:site-specific DNA-methyltransferase [Sphingomonas azotifigens]|uniref:site-specific DNA-methyltransferase n=1 Tax=Sphingomonas azotifigens TaxID=330920 RepID=UPI0009FE1B6A|nr:site-specific DNA-methyltransferase [Sphingomonas azotifigens]